MPLRKVGGSLSIMETREAMAALGSIDTQRAWLSDRVIAPWWYHPALGVLAGGLVATGEARNGMIFAWGVVAYTLGAAAVTWVNQRRVGLRMRYFDVRTSAVFAVEVLGVAVVVGLACWLGLAQHLDWAFPIAGLVSFLIVVGCGRWTDRVLRARLRTLP